MVRPRRKYPGPSVEAARRKGNIMITCVIQYTLDPHAIEAFEKYATTWPPSTGRLRTVPGPAGRRSAGAGQRGVRPGGAGRDSRAAIVPKEGLGLGRRCRSGPARPPQ